MSSSRLVVPNAAKEAAKSRRLRGPSAATAAPDVHGTLLRGAGATQRVAGPVILQRLGDDFVQALLDQLGDDGGLAAALATRALPTDGIGILSLYQPVHRVYHLVLVEAVCDVPGLPRIDGSKIESAGLVLRRRSLDATGQIVADAMEGWMQEAPTPRSRASGASKERTLRGWVRFAGRATVPDTDLDDDPDPARRRAARRAGHPEIDRLIATRGPAEAFGERVTPLFVAPPELCAAAGKTLLYGLVPVTSAESGERPDAWPAFDAQVISDHLPGFLRAGLAPSIPRAGEFLRRANVTGSTVPADLATFLADLRQIAVELGITDDTPEATSLRSALDAVTLIGLDTTRWPESGSASQRALMIGSVGAAMRNGQTLAAGQELMSISLGSWLVDACNTLVAGTSAAAVRVPIYWPSPTATQASAILAAVQRVLAARLSTLAPREPRFGDATRQYRLRAFVRVRGHDHCPPRITWSDYSEPFTIAPWFTPSPAPPAIIALPDLSLSRKPSVVFQVPKKLMDVLNANKPKDLMDGNGSEGSGLALDWLCSFSIPIITLCAFIVLNIFLSLFDIIFRWMMFVKICIPIPRRSTS